MYRGYMLDVYGRVWMTLYAGTTNHYPIPEKSTYQLCISTPNIELHLLLSILICHMTNYLYSDHTHCLNRDTERCDIGIQCLPQKRHTLRQTLGIEFSSLDCRAECIHSLFECCSRGSSVCIHALEHNVIGEHVAHYTESTR
jgi:hypothetical protein